MKRWEVTGLLSWTDKNNDGRIQYYNDASKDTAFQGKVAAAGWQGNELSVNRDIIVLANPEIALLPNWVIALVAAGGVAAALSTAAGLLLAISSAISHDLLKKIFMPDMSEKNEETAGRKNLHGMRHRRCRLSGSESSGLCRWYCRPWRLVSLPARSSRP